MKFASSTGALDYKLSGELFERFGARLPTMGGRRVGDFLRGARDGQATNLAEGNEARPRDARQTRDANQIRFQADIAEGYRVASGCERREVTLPSHAEFFTQVAGEGRHRMCSRGFEGGELPHAREQRAIAVQLANEQGAPARIKEHGCGESNLDRCAFLARGRQLFLDAELAGT